MDDSDFITTADNQIDELEGFLEKLQSDFDNSFQNFKKEMISSIKLKTVEYQKQWLHKFNEELINRLQKNNVKNHHSFDNSGLIDFSKLSSGPKISAPLNYNMIKSRVYIFVMLFFEK